MPNYRGHLTGACIIYCVIIFALSFYTRSPITLIEWLLCTLLGSLFPDIDTKSKGQKLFYRFTFLIACLFFVQQKFRLLGFIAILACFPLITKHRGLLHNIWFIMSFVIILLLGAYYIIPQYFMPIAVDMTFFMIGVISHLWLDFGFLRMIRLR